MAISLSSIAWIGVVILQAILHFIIIGRRRKEKLLLYEDEIAAENVNKLSSKITNSFSDRTKAQDDEHEDLSDSDECESMDDGQQRIISLTQKLPVLERRSSCLLQSDQPEALKTRTRVEMDNEDAIDNSSTVPNDTHNEKISSSTSENPHMYCDSDDIDDCSRNTSNADDYDSDCDNIDDDEQWRYELMKQYYAPSAETILTIASQSSLEPDEAELTLRKLHESLEARQPNHLHSNVSSVEYPDNVDERLEFLSKSSQVHVMPSISCA